MQTGGKYYSFTLSALFPAVESSFFSDESAARMDCGFTAINNAGVDQCNTKNQQFIRSRSHKLVP